jgi:hypothetical protein
MPVEGVDTANSVLGEHSALTTDLDSTLPHESDEVGSGDPVEADNGLDFVSDDGSDDSVILFSDDEDPSDRGDPRANVLSVLELEELFMKVAPDLSSMFFTLFHFFAMSFIQPDR